jgi:predicted DNA-binding transcriptional regulator YafY
MYTLIAQGRHPSVDILMERLDISKRTVFRYLRIIDTIDRITYSPRQRGYAFLEGNRADTLRLSHDELAVVLAAGEAVSHLGKSFGERFRRLIGTIDLAHKPK